jgi:ribosomal peptide maturation radical SAM protein 1
MSTDDARVRPSAPAPRPIALLSPPWPLYTRPSIQLGALKAVIRSRFPEVAVAAQHVYLNIAASIGYARYHGISERTWLAETVYGAMLYPQKRPGMARLFRSEAAGSRLLRRADFAQLVSQVQAATEQWLAAQDWRRFRMVGVSSVLCQLTAGLYFIRRLRELNPELTIVAGGAAYNQQSAAAALALFPEIDAVVCGEGELPLCHLVEHHVVQGLRLAEVPPAGGVVRRDGPTPGASGRGFYQLENLDHLPVPDFDDYFATLAELSPAQRFFPTLPVEVSRGCWWQRADTDAQEAGCEFCNLNLQWRGYRCKSPGRAVSEIDQLTRRHRLLAVAFMDNVLPKDSTAELLRGLAALDRDLSIFAEIRATTPLSELRRMPPAGMRRVQVGIEALSTRLLRKLRKGTTAIQNLEIMKHCEALGIVNLSNLILDFPASDEADVAETLHAMEFAGSFRPPKPVSFWLGLGSPAWRHAEAHGLRQVGNHPHWARIFPPRVFRRLPFVIQAYRDGAGRQRRLWRPVRARLRQWAQAYDDLHRGAPAEPILSYRDGGDFLILRERRADGDAATHRLEGSSRRIYLFCSHHRPLQRVIANFASLPADKITSFLRMMTAQKLMFCEDDQFLSLAVPVRMQD